MRTNYIKYADYLVPYIYGIFTLHYENMPIQTYRKLYLQKPKIFR